jgi:hypothetical protein
MEGEKNVLKVIYIENYILGKLPASNNVDQKKSTEILLLRYTFLRNQASMMIFRYVKYFTVSEVRNYWRNKTDVGRATNQKNNNGALAFYARPTHVKAVISLCGTGLKNISAIKI